MRRVLIATTMCGALSAPQGAVAGERMIDLFRQGYQLVATEPYLSFDGCEFDKAIPVGGYVFKCRTYEYVYHYGKAEVLGRTFVSKGQTTAFVYLCPGEDHCVAGALYAR
jgi:hypothetical protein